MTVRELIAALEKIDQPEASVWLLAGHRYIAPTDVELLEGGVLVLGVIVRDET